MSLVACKVAFPLGKSHSMIVLSLYTNWRTAILLQSLRLASGFDAQG